MEGDVPFVNIPRRKRNAPHTNALRNDSIPEVEAGDVESQPRVEERSFETTFIRFKQMNPPIFEGKMDSSEAEKWLEEMEMLFEVLKCNDGQKLFLAVYQLKDNARDWWKAEKMTLDLDVAITWDMFKHIFYENYFPSNTRQQKEIEFSRLEQGTMSVSEYRAKFLELSKFGSKWISDEVGRTRKFEMGLHPRIRKFTVPLQINTFSTIVEKSLLIEREFNSTRSVEGEPTRKRSFSSSSQGSFQSRDRGKNQMVPQRSGSMVSRNFSAWCTYCHNNSHDTKDCRRLNSSCFLCGKNGHYRANCPQQRRSFGNFSREYRGPTNQRVENNQSTRTNHPPPRSQARVFSLNQEQAQTSNAVVSDHIQK